MNAEQGQRLAVTGQLSVQSGQKDRRQSTLISIAAAEHSPMG